MGTLLVASFVILIVVTGGLAYASYRRHSRAAQARSRAALQTLMEQAYKHGEETTRDEDTQP